MYGASQILDKHRAVTHVTMRYSFLRTPGGWSDRSTAPLVEGLKEIHRPAVVLVQNMLGAES